MTVRRRWTLQDLTHYRTTCLSKSRTNSTAELTKNKADENFQFLFSNFSGSLSQRQDHFLAI